MSFSGGELYPLSLAPEINFKSGASNVHKVEESLLLRNSPTPAAAWSSILVHIWLSSLVFVALM